MTELPLEAEPKQKRVWTAGSLEIALAEKFCAPEWAFLPQVRNQTGYNKRIRTADAMAMSLWPSRGLHLHGFEIKISRSDWLAEKRDPSKAEEFQQYCDFWWMVLADASIIQPGELPPGWGVIVPKGGKLVFSKEAQINKEPKAVDRTFLAGLLRKASEVIVDSSKLHAAEQAAYERGRKREQESQSFEMENLKRTNQRLQESIDNFRKDSGVSISAAWRGGNIGNYVATAQKRDWQTYRKELDSIRLQVRNILDDINHSLDLSRKDGEICDWII